jgi:hypothetical protein
LLLQLFLIKHSKSILIYTIYHLLYLYHYFAKKLPFYLFFHIFKYSFSIIDYSNFIYRIYYFILKRHLWKILESVTVMTMTLKYFKLLKNQLLHQSNLNLYQTYKKLNFFNHNNSNPLKKYNHFTSSKNKRHHPIKIKTYCFVQIIMQMNVQCR